MPITEGVVHLGDHDAQNTITIMAEPKTDRIKDVAQRARLGQKLDTAHLSDPVRIQNAAYPCNTLPLFGCSSMVYITYGPRPR